MDRSKLVYYLSKVREAVGILATNPSHLKNRLTKAGPHILLINIDELPSDELRERVSSLKSMLAKNFPEEGVSIGRKHTKTLIPIAEGIWALYFLLQKEVDASNK